MTGWPFKLSNPAHARRLEMLEEIADTRGSVTTMGAQTSKERREDLRWLWRTDLLGIVYKQRAGDDEPMTYGITIKGAEALEYAPEARRRLEEKKLADEEKAR